MALLDVRWVNFRSTRDERGCLTVVEGGKDIPFPIVRIFYVHDVVSDVDRGGHRDTDKLAVAVPG